LTPGIRDMIRGKMSPAAILKMMLGKPKLGTIPATDYVALITDKMQTPKGEQLPGTWILVAFKLPDMEAAENG